MGLFDLQLKWPTLKTPFRALKKKGLYGIRWLGIFIPLAEIKREGSFLAVILLMGSNAS
jgi:hypothetical protein